MENNTGNKKVISNVVYFILASAFVVILFKYTNVFEPNNQNVNTNVNTSVPIDINSGDLQNINTTVEPSNFEKYIQLKEAGKVLSVIGSRLISPQFTANDQAKNNAIALQYLQLNSKRIVSTGNITRGYLYVKASAGSVANLGTIATNESVYTYLGSEGGHLFFPDSLVNIPTEDGLSQFLFDLSDIEFTNIPYSENNSSHSQDWLARLNTAGEYFIGAFVSANRFATIEEVTIVYEGKGDLEIK